MFPQTIVRLINSMSTLYSPGCTVYEEYFQGFQRIPVVYTERNLSESVLRPVSNQHPLLQHGRSNGLHDVYVIMLEGSRDMLPWINKTK